jgi:hypothetical protein
MKFFNVILLFGVLHGGLLGDEKINNVRAGTEAHVINSMKIDSLRGVVEGIKNTNKNSLSVSYTIIIFPTVDGDVCNWAAWIRMQEDFIISGSFNPFKKEDEQWRSLFIRSGIDFQKAEIKQLFPDFEVLKKKIDQDGGRKEQEIPTNMYKVLFLGPKRSFEKSVMSEHLDQKSVVREIFGELHSLYRMINKD